MKRITFRLLPLLGLLVGLCGPATAQDLTIRKTTEPITVDGKMDESVWNSAEVATNFHQFFPTDTVMSPLKTEVRVLYDAENLYILARMWSVGPRDEYVTPSFRRDYRGRAFDGFSAVLDTYQDRTNAFSFGINPFGVRREGLVSNGGELSLTWDNKWFGTSTIEEDHWVAEMAIPFKTIRYKENLDTWFVNFYRVDSELGEISTWSPVPLNLSPNNLAFNREVQFVEPLNDPGSNISVIPYAAFGTAKDFVAETPSTSDFDVGGDAKIALSSAMNFDLTINPDFSQVEVDQQVTNLDRFEIFFPERRQFFLENADLFSSFGSSRTTPFFSRRIGVARDTATGTNVQNPIYLGARLSGKINNDWRVGLLSVQTARDNRIQLPSTNFTVASLQRKVWERSNISAIFVNKQAVQDSIGGDFTLDPSAWNRTLGADFNYASADGYWTGKAYYHRTWDQDQRDSTFSLGLNLELDAYRWGVRTGVRSVGANFNPEAGFVRRRDFQQHFNTIEYNFYPQRGPIQSHGPGFDYDIVGNQQFGVTDWDVNLLYRIAFRNTANFRLRLRRQFTYLFREFDASGTGGLALPEGSSHWYNFIIASYESDQRKSFFYELSTRSGEYYNGTRINLEGSFTYRFQPYGFVSLDFAYNRIRLPEPYNDGDLYLIGPRVDITFSKNIFWTTFVQYNNQINNMNINTRFQWRYAPVSDLFVVYTDNYFTDINNRFVDFGAPKSRSLVLKVTYWLNV
ncbi:carbohydrate binding family 9 domain-containing protein [Lewinella sp. W8]|uniref:carbohydrate binding family 9 domain-containing protein n=1 Tax=Lewinella sp. W8 TaxID=2528208 RepID=UPI001566EC39|nr:carbohydrate binding family 9 domain-containing protein [Lewinella sp. W8]